MNCGVWAAASVAAAGASTGAAGTRVTVGNPPALILTLDGHPYDLGGVTQRGVARFVIH